MFQPEIATTWLTPAVVKAAARSRSTRSRRPMRIPDASPACGSGRARVRASSPARRMPSIVEAGPPASPTIARSVVAERPVHARCRPGSGRSRRRTAARIGPRVATIRPGPDRRVARQRRGDPDDRRARARPAPPGPGRGGQLEGRDLLAVPRRPDARDGPDPGPGARRSAASAADRARAGRPARARSVPRRGPRRPTAPARRAAVPAEPARAPRARPRPSPAIAAERGRSTASSRPDRRRDERDDDRPGGGPARAWHQCTTTSPRSFSNVAGPTSLRVWRSVDRPEAAGSLATR